MIAANPAVIATFAAYLMLMLAIRFWAYRRTVDSSGYFLGGRSLEPWPAALSAGASDMSGWLLLARRLRTYSVEANDALTIPEFFANRFGDQRHLLQAVAAFFVLLFFLFYTSSGLVAARKLFETVFGLDYQIAVIVGTLFIVSYTLFGGFLAVSWTDFIQGLLMAAALLIVPVIAIQSDGGWGARTTTLRRRIRSY